MPVRSLNRRQLGEFKRMLEIALSEVIIPSGIIDTNHIRPGAVRPENCKMDASWNFKGNVSAGGKTLNQVTLPAPVVRETKTNRNIQELNSSADLLKYPNTDIFFLDALRDKVIVNLPPASKNVGRKMYFKRVDQLQGSICRIITTGDDTLDGTLGIELGPMKSVIIVASSTNWFVLSSI